MKNSLINDPHLKVRFLVNRIQFLERELTDLKTKANEYAVKNNHLYSDVTQIYKETRKKFKELIKLAHEDLVAEMAELKVILLPENYSGIAVYYNRYHKQYPTEYKDYIDKFDFVWEQDKKNEES